MRILDRQRYWAFIKAYFICYVSLVGLWIVIDAFSNVDEFMKRAEGGELLRIMGQYYLVHQAQYFDMLGGVISMMAAIFTVTWMQRNNEQLAMLAAGISTHRAIRPVLVSAVLVSLLAVANQEVIIPRYADEIQKSHDDDGVRKVQVPSRYDSRGVMITREADRVSRTIINRFNTTLPPQIFGGIHEIEGRQATYIPPDDPRAPCEGLADPGRG
ncbi:MAG: LptF/LptG family permease [Isosphaeraceae bacterium]